MGLILESEITVIDFLAYFFERTCRLPTLVYDPSYAHEILLQANGTIFKQWVIVNQDWAADLDHWLDFFGLSQQGVWLEKSFVVLVVPVQFHPRGFLGWVYKIICFYKRKFEFPFKKKKTFD
jgi:hypothetical protein